MNSLFITGTDTGVGKTVLTAAIVAAARATRQDVVPMKPVQTGCDACPGGTLSTPDLDWVLSLTDIDASPEMRSLMCPCRYVAPCSPHLAAAREHRPVQMASILDAYTQLAASHDAVVVEGAGGILVPLTESETMRDLARALGLEVVVAARPGLGTLNHTLLTIDALQSADIPVRAVVFVQSTSDPLSFIEDDNRETIAQRSGVPVLEVLPFIPGINDPGFTPTQFKDIVLPILSTLAT